jgi:uncharacterized membrane protein
MSDSDINELRRLVQELSERVARLERIANGHAQRTTSPPPIPIRPGPSLESRLGSQYLNRAGIIALLVGVSYFLHLAFSNNWIGPPVQIGIGLGGGLAVVWLGHWFERRRYSAFGLSLKALGIGVLYLSVWAGLQLYHLMSMPVAAAAMIVITAATVMMSSLQESEGLAALAFVGGFATPILLYTGENLYGALFAYVLLLSLAMLLLVRRFPWKNLLLVSFLGCVGVNAAWYAEAFIPAFRIPFGGYATALLAIFLLAALPIAKEHETAITWFVGIGACVCYLLAIDGAWRENASWFVAPIGLVLIGLTWKLPPKLAPGTFFLGVAYCAAAVPIAFDPHWTTSVAWLAIGTLTMIAGFAKQLAFVRWAALWLIGITVIKVFAFDLARLEQGYRVLAATILGVALLAISFAYQRYRLRQD